MTNPVTKKVNLLGDHFGFVLGGFIILLLISEGANLPMFTAYLTKCKQRIFCSKEISPHILLSCQTCYIPSVSLAENDQTFLCPQ